MHVAQHTHSHAHSLCRPNLEHVLDALQSMRSSLRCTTPALAYYDIEAHLLQKHSGQSVANSQPGGAGRRSGAPPPRRPSSIAAAARTAGTSAPAAKPLSAPHSLDAGDGCADEEDKNSDGVVRGAAAGQASANAQQDPASPVGPSTKPLPLPRSRSGAGRNGTGDVGSTTTGGTATYSYTADGHASALGGGGGGGSGGAARGGGGDDDEAGGSWGDARHVNAATERSVYLEHSESTCGGWGSMMLMQELSADTLTGPDEPTGAGCPFRGRTGGSEQQQQ